MKHTPFNLSLLPIYLVLFFDNFAFAIIFSIFGPLFLDPSLQFIPAEIGIATRNLMLAVTLALFPLGQLVGAPLIGDIADRFGRKKAFYITILGGAIGIAGSGLSIAVGSFVFLILTRLLTGIFSGNLSICLASIADLSHNEKTRARNFSVIVIITGVSWMLAILAGSVLANKEFSRYFAPSLPFFLTAILFFLTFLMVVYFFKETHKTSEKFRIDLWGGIRDVVHAFTINKLQLLYLMYMFWILGWGIAFQWYSPAAIQRFHASPITISWNLFVVGITWIFGGYSINNFLIKRWKTLPLIVIGNALTTLLVLGMAFAPSFLSFAIFFGIACIPSAFAWPNMLNVISINAPENIQGKIMGISQSFQALGFVLAIILGGICASLNPQFIYYFATLFVFIGFVYALVRQLQTRRQQG